jgi:hypothetical protein
LEHAPSAADKAGVLLAYLDRVLAEDEEPQIEIVRERIHDLVEQHELDEAYIDTQMKIGNYYVAKDRRRHLEGCRHYTAALARATDVFVSSDNVVPMAKVAAHIVFALPAINVNDRVSHVGRLLQQLEEWTIDELSDIRDSDAARYLLWPFRSAQRLVDGTDGPFQPLPSYAKHIVEEELQRLTRESV